eukprot:CAMPEP_0194185458 /NCGR_PEP_ID=MMETSP0154-20130528/42815_1 /TAXON_ID=1049557 /ORGANISM="Thalassiothrix antarctica, Strain L6-D1" /LENGTH=217 /DNA_ID=CAMNT_0038903811 /DNA_START=71 /DNA_END=721 /DNA_ORIENTATION=+
MMKTYFLLFHFLPLTSAFQSPVSPIKVVNRVSLGGSSNTPPSEEEIVAMEKEVLAGTRARLDIRSINESFLDEEKEQKKSLLDTWKVALAAGLMSSAATGLLFHSIFISIFACVATTAIAIGDPVSEQSPAGALARVLGRVTLQTVSQPKVKAIARAAVRNDDEVLKLRERLRDLEEENEELYLWKKRRITVDEALSKYNVDELKEQARQNRIKIGG